MHATRDLCPYPIPTASLPKEQKPTCRSSPAGRTRRTCAIGTSTFYGVKHDRKLPGSHTLRTAEQPDVDAQGPYNGLTALHDAAWHGHLDAVRSLIKAGARLDLLGHAGLTPRALVLQYGYNEIASSLVERNEST
ncbi:ankyrin repeat domain-containing protein [Rhizobium leguminosarum]|uniref:ankyrin repeat domain-containing protein n=1 Tax=Rhizobium leguminosarum TaxID=384 RepID=UPI0012FAB8FB